MTSEKARLQAALQSIQSIEKAAQSALSSLDSKLYESWEPLWTDQVQSTLDNLQVLYKAVESLKMIATDEDLLSELPAALHNMRIDAMLDIAYLYKLVENACIAVAAYKPHAQSVSRECLRQRVDIRKRIEALKTQGAKALKEIATCRSDALRQSEASTPTNEQPPLTLMTNERTGGSD